MQIRDLITSSLYHPRATMDGRMNGWLDGWMNRWMYRLALINSRVSAARNTYVLVFRVLEKNVPIVLYIDCFENVALNDFFC